MNPFIVLRESDDFSRDEVCTEYYTTVRVWIGNEPGPAYNAGEFCRILNWGPDSAGDGLYEVHFERGRFSDEVLIAARTGRDTDQDFKSLEDALAFVTEIYIECCKH